jgi:archaellum biogenesis ATPase FlaH
MTDNPFIKKAQMKPSYERRRKNKRLEELSEKRRIEASLLRLLTDPREHREDLLVIQTLYSALSKIDEIAEARPLLRKARKLLRRTA